jgi:translation elongation factor P/translation initiation factor 5A
MSTASDLERGSSFLYHGEVLRVVRKEVVAVGTHSHTKLKFFCRPLFGGGERAITLAHQDKVEKVEAMKKTASIISKLPDKVQIMDTHSYETIDAEVADKELLEELKEGDFVIFVDYAGKAVVVEKTTER